MKVLNFAILMGALIKTVATTTKLEMTDLSHCTRWYSAWLLPL